MRSIFENLHICYPCLYGGKALNPPVMERSPMSDFELTDKSGESALCESGRGETSYRNVKKREINIFHVDLFFKQLNGRSFMSGNTNICDYMLVSDSVAEDGVILFNELTESQDNDSLQKPIKDKSGNIKFALGKWEKGVVQLESTLSLLTKHSCVREAMDAYVRKVCLFSYKIGSLEMEGMNKLSAFTAYRDIEALETRNSGARIRNTKIEGMGFEYYRIAYPGKFAI